MTRVNSICGMVSVMASVMVSVLVSMMASGCMHVDPQESSAETELGLESQPSANEPGYGYEMIPLQLNSNASAPVGDSLMPNGRVAPEEVLRQATARIDGLRTCYANALATDPTLAGEVRAIHKFGMNGELSSLQIQSELRLTPEFTNCLKATLSTMRMPATNGGTLHVDYPITLDPAVVSTAP
jgi:hypothetical protein